VTSHLAAPARVRRQEPLRPRLASYRPYRSSPSRHEWAGESHPAWRSRRAWHMMRERKGRQPSTAAACARGG
jgi:hypothetical protein